jgi:carboxypeptidase Q
MLRAYTMSRQMRSQARAARSRCVLSDRAGSVLPFFAVIGLLAPLAADTRLDADMARKIRQEASARSKILHTVHVLADVYGPRLTGSPNVKAAAEWAVETMKSWGLTNGHLEPFDFGRPGWVNERFAAHIVSPVKDSLVGEVLAWTPDTNGTVTARAFLLNVTDRPTESELTAYLGSFRDEVRGKIVLVDKSVVIPVDLNPPPKRADDERMRQRFAPTRRPDTTGRAAPPERDRRPNQRAAGQPAPRNAMSAVLINRRIDEFLVASGALLRVDDARRELGQIAAFHNATYDVNAVVPSVVLRNEDYGRIARLLADGTPVELEFTIVNRLYPEGRTAHNAIAEIEGSDKKDEIVILGGHLDSWHSSTGATDNAIGCAVVMEAGRILKALGIRPRRTIRIALWSGEEQGLLGSRAYIAEHFGAFENPKPDFFKLAGYVNLDHGTGRPRGATVFGPASGAAAVWQALAFFTDLGIVGAIPTSSRIIGSTDHTSFNNAGLPGIDLELDPIEYDSHTHHTNLDTYERILESDAKSAAIMVAATAYHLAMRDEMLPRFSKSEMLAPR